MFDMGCWNGTCGISQLPILGVTKVKTVLLLQSEFNQNVQSSGACYITEYFRPWFLPVTAEYNDYGSIKNIEMDWNAKYMLNRFQEWLASGHVKILDGDECEVNSPDIDKFETLEDVFACVERGALVAKSTGTIFDEKSQNWVPSGGYLKISMFMVLIPVWESLLVEDKRFKTLTENDHWLKHETEVKEKAIKAIEKARAKVGGEKEMDELEGCIYDIHVDRSLGDLIDEHYCFKHYKPLLNSPDKVTIEEFFFRIEEIRGISSAMTFLRKLWFPQAGQGSQSEELSFNKALIYGMNKHIAEREVENEKWRKEDEEWDKKYEAEQTVKKEKNEDS